MTTVFVASLGALLPVTNPVFVLAVYAGLTESFSTREVRRQATLVGVYSFLILGAFALLGTLILHAFGISLYALQIAGGLVVAYAGFEMVSQREGFTGAEQRDALDRFGKRADIAISPMALPIVAGPGAIGVVIALGARNPGLESHLDIVAAVATISVGLALLLRWATPLVGRLGPVVVGALVRVMGFLILAIGVELVTHGVLELPR
jgi:multiple antibiotic resistance protein